MRSATQWFDAYGVSHQNPVNKAIHWVAIPAIMLSLLGVLASMPFPVEVAYVNWSTVVLAAAVAFYTRLSWTIALGMGAAGSVCIGINQQLANADVPLLQFSLAVFAIAWAFQFVGHKIEGEKPSFFEDLQFLLIGPAWLMQFVFKKVGIPIETWAGRAFRG